MPSGHFQDDGTSAIHEVPGVQTPLARVIANIYIIIIVLIIGTMIVHWLIDLRKQIHLVNLKKQIIRMTFNEVGSIPS